MKYCLLFIVSLISFTLFSQTPRLINYQGVARDASGLAITNQNVNIKFEIFNTPVGGVALFTDNQTAIPTGSLGVFYTQIGKSPADLSVITWSLGTYFLEVTISGSFGSGTLQRNQLVSVPYALYAEIAGNAGITYTAGNGINISGGIISNTLITANTTTINGTGLANITPNFGSVFSVNVPTPALNYNNGSNILTLTQGTAVTTASLNSLGSNTISITGSGNAIVTPTTGNSFNVSVSPQTLSNNSNTIILSGGGGNVVMPLTTVTGSNGIAVTGNPLSGYIVTNTAVPSITFANAITGTVFSGTGNSTGFTIPSPVLTASTGINITGSWPTQTISATGGTNTAWGILGNAGTTSTVNFIGTTDATDLVFRTSGSQRAIIQAGGNMGVGVITPLAKLDVSAGNGPVINASLSGTGNVITANTSGAGTVINANTSGAGTGINVNATTGAAIIASNNGGTDAVSITNSGTGNALRVSGNSAVQTLLVNNLSNGGAMYAFKSGTTQGYAGYFENLNPNNGIETLKAVNQSTVNGAIALNVTSANTGTGQIALQINEGHIKSVLSGTTMPTPTTATATSGFILGGNTFTITNNTDTKGTLVIDNTGTGILAGGFMDINVPFKKHYNIGATVLITPVVTTTNSDKYSYYLLSQTNTFFTIRIKNNTAGSITNLSTDRFIINYFVIE